MTSRLLEAFPIAARVLPGMAGCCATLLCGQPGGPDEQASALSFTNAFKAPIGPRGLEYTDAIRVLEGRRVRMEGFMVRQASPIPYSLLLSPVPLTLHEKEYGLAEDLPANAAHVFLRKSSTPFLRPIRGPVVVEGRLELGPREEADGRISNIRLAEAQLQVGTNVFPAIPESSGRLSPAIPAQGSVTAVNEPAPSKVPSP